MKRLNIGVNLTDRPQEWHITQAVSGGRASGESGEGAHTISAAPAERRTDTLSIDGGPLMAAPDAGAA